MQYTTNGTNTQIWDVRLLQQIQHLGKHQNESPHTQNTCDKTFVGARSKQYHTKNVAHVNHGWCYKPKYIFRFKSFTNKQCICVPLIGIQQDQMCIKEHQDFNPNPVDCQAATNIGHIQNQFCNHYMCMPLVFSNFAPSSVSRNWVMLAGERPYVLEDQLQNNSLLSSRSRNLKPLHRSFHKTTCLPKP